MAFTENISDFFDTDDFAVAATWNAQTVNGIFDNEYFDEPGGVGIEGSTPVFLCAAADVNGIAHDDDITINGTAYKVVGVQPDGTGAVELKLQEQ
ncbi:MAG: hypothetical protein GY771_01115 [bacterium]|nr:hypothetical protein [bacterium]